MKFLIKGPFIRAVPRVFECKNLFFINKIIDFLAVPFYGIHLKLTLVIRHVYRTSYLRVFGVVERLCMHRVKNRVWDVPYMLHDINLPASRPSSVFVLGRQHPYSRPNTAAGSCFRPYFYFSIEPVSFPFGRQPAGGVIKAIFLIFFFLSSNVKKFTVTMRVFAFFGSV